MGIDSTAASDLTRNRWIFACLLAGSLLISWSYCLADEVPIEIASGLTIQKIADDDVAPDCSAITVDSQGRIVASGPGYIRSFVLDHSNSLSESKTLATGLKHGAHGLCFHEDDLYYTADNGIWKVVDTDADGYVDSTPTQVLKIKTGGEHDAHALRMGPDGFWYLICGNGTKGMFDLQNDSDPVIPNPRAGAIWRISQDWTQRSVWAHGFRNAYDFDFAPGHTIDTFDSDGERDVSLPWYRPTRIYRVAQGDDAGWVSRSWKRPNHDPKMPRVLSDLGRGSPTGVMRYRNQRLPQRFHHGVLVLDWTFGRIAFVSDAGKMEIVAKPNGTAGFAVTDIAELPDGRIVVSVGGRRSRGGIYLIDATNPGPTKSQATLWIDKPTIQAKSPDAADAKQRIVALRQQKTRQISTRDLQAAINILQKIPGESDALVAMALMIESLGGVGPDSKIDARGKERFASVFDGYRSRLEPTISDYMRRKTESALVAILKQSDSDTVKNECIRTLAVVEARSVWSEIFDHMNELQSPTDKLHCLIALECMPRAYSATMTLDVIKPMLDIPVLVQQQNLNIDRNWSQRLGELFVSIRRNNSLLPTRLVTHPDFGHPTHLVWTHRMNPEGLEIARRRFLREGDNWKHPDVARFIALGNDAVPRRYIRHWLEAPQTREAGWIALASHPQPADADELNKAALSLNKQVREIAEKALRSLDLELPQRTIDSESIKTWIAKSQQIADMKGSSVNGKTLFKTRQCANCHNGATALGPSLSGISKRFAAADLLRATVDPDHTISDRYQAQKIVTTDDRVVVGMKIYQSVDGITLLTADAQTKRVNADQIEQIKPSTRSLMPSGLLDGMSDQSVADLIAYLGTL